ncbi:MAG: SdpI family protein [Patescibacteria group bacterium]
MSHPIKPDLKTEWLPVLLLILSFGLAIYFYQSFPERVATHWGLDGQVNGYSSRGVAAFLLPGMALGMYLLFLVIPYFDPKKEQYAAFAPVYHRFKSLMVGFLSLLFVMMGLNGLGYTVDMGFWTPLLIGALFIAIGWLLNKVKMNWFMGIRTPWTLSSETVWDKTHAASGKVFLLAGLLMAATVLAPGIGKIVLFILAIAILVLALPIYSYYLYRQEKAGKK